jgi:hypothetical protein
MKGEAKVAVIIPALNEELAITEVISAIPNWVDDLIVVDNGSTDSTAMVARSMPAWQELTPSKKQTSSCSLMLISVITPMRWRTLLIPLWTVVLKW